MKEKINILIAEDDSSWRNLLTDILQREGYTVFSAGSGKEAIGVIDSNDFRVVLTDMRMETEFSGFDVLEHIEKVSPSTQVIILTEFGSIEMAKEAMKRGAFEFFAKDEPESTNQLIREKVVEALKINSVENKSNFHEVILQKFPSFFSEIFYQLSSDLEPMAKLKTQIDLFDSVLKFPAIIIIKEYLTGEERLDALGTSLLKVNISVPTWGNWFYMASELCKRKKYLANNSFLDAFADFFKGENRAIMSDFIDIRNTRWAHCGQLSDAEYSESSKECEKILNTLLKDLKFLENYLLCNFISIRFVRGRKIHKMYRCRGVDPMILGVERAFENFLPCEEVLLINLKNERYISLEPFLILEDCPKCGQKELFVYSRISHNSIHYQSYKTGHQYETDKYLNRFNELFGIN